MEYLSGLKPKQKDNMEYTNRTFASIQLILLIFLPKLDTLEAQSSNALETKTGNSEPTF